MPPLLLQAIARDELAHVSIVSARLDCSNYGRSRLATSPTSITARCQLLRVASRDLQHTMSDAPGQPGLTEEQEAGPPLPPPGADDEEDADVGPALPKAKKRKVGATAAATAAQVQQGASAAAAACRRRRLREQRLLSYVFPPGAGVRGSVLGSAAPVRHVREELHAPRHGCAAWRGAW